MESKKSEELFAQGCSYLKDKHKKYNDTKCFDTIKENEFMAKDRFQKSAEMGYAPAMRELARCYIEGYGIVFKNKVTKGIKYLKQAILAGDSNALNYCLENEAFFTQFVDGDAHDDLKAISDYYEAYERGDISTKPIDLVVDDQQKPKDLSSQEETFEEVVKSGVSDIKKEWNKGISGLKQVWKEGIDDIKQASKGSKNK